MEKLILIKYGELTTKKGNRNSFINKLNENIKNKLNGIDYEIIKTRDRMYIKSIDIDLVLTKLKKVFGLHSIVIAYKVNNNDIESNVLRILKTSILKLLKLKQSEVIKSLIFHRWNIIT